jgi:predicted deacylase
MELQVGDRFTDHGFEWEVLTHPTAMHGARTLRARITRPGLPETEREVTWQAHERSVIRRLHDTDDGGLSGHVKPGKNREAADRLAALTSPSDAEANAEVARK